MNIRRVNKELQEKAEKELYEVPSRVADDIKHIKTWLAQQPHINARTEDQWILTFLRSCKFSLQETKQKLDWYYTVRNMRPLIFKNRDPFLPEIQEILDLCLGAPLSKTVGPAGPRILFFRADNLHAKLNPIAFVKTTLMIIDILMYEDDNYIIAGQHSFCDCTNASYDMALSIDMLDIKRLDALIDKAYPIRPQSIDIVNVPSFFEFFFNMAKPLMSQKIKERVHVYSNSSIENIEKLIPRSHLPREYGGDGDSLHDLSVYWRKKVESYRDWFLDDEQYCTDESKRPGKPKNVEHVFGIEGSFRQINID